jgi:colicin import membrane protein
MRPSEFTEEQIIEAGQGLEEEGRRVTGYAIRGVLGGGNATRLKNIWDTFQQSQQVVETEPMQELPVEVQGALDSMAGEFLGQLKSLVIALNNKAVATAELRVSNAVKAARADQEKAEAELLDADTTVEDLESKLDQTSLNFEESQRSLNESVETNEKQSKELTELNKKLAVMKEKTDSITAQLDQEQEENENRQQEITRLIGQVDDLKADKKAETKSAAEWKKKAEKHEKKAFDLLQEKTVLAKHLSDSEHQLDTEKTVSAAKDSNIDEIRAAGKFQANQLNDATDKATKLEKAVTVAELELKQSQATNTDLKNQFEKLQSELIKIASNKGKQKG